MPRLKNAVFIKEGQICQDPWIYLDNSSPVPPACRAIVSFDRWNRERESLLSNTDATGVCLETHHNFNDVYESLQAIGVIAIHINKFSDGRYFTLARLLRERLEFRGELRACGDVLADQLFYMKRCGFDAFELKPGKSVEAGLAALQTFSQTYQAAVDEKRPLFVRRERGVRIE